jgi:excinuclease ABC subunit B
MTDSMREAISLTERRRMMQVAYNEEHGITPQTVMKNVADILGRLRSESAPEPSNKLHGISALEDRLPDDLNLEIARVEKAMLAAARDLLFEEAAALRDYLQTLQRQGFAAELDGLALDTSPVS